MSKTLNTGNRYKNLFLQQSYFDNTDLYSEILRRERTDDSHCRRQIHHFVQSRAFCGQKHTYSYRKRYQQFGRNGCA